MLPLALLLLTPLGQAAEPHTADTLRPFLHNEVNALELNHYYLQSMFASDLTVPTVGWSVRAAPASYQRLDGGVTEGGLAKNLFILSIGLGNPTTEAAWFVGLNASTVRPSGYPNIWALGGDSESSTLIKAVGRSMVGFAGFALQGTAIEAAVHFQETYWDANSAGEFQGGGCSPEFGCTGRQPRDGSPVSSGPQQYDINRTAFLFNVENAYGYHAEVLVEDLSPFQDGSVNAKQSLAAVRALAQPAKMFAPETGLIGTGLNFFAKELDYYGDHAQDIQDARVEGATAPEAPTKGIVEIPLVGDRLLDSGLKAKIIPQIFPKPAFRMAEFGYVHLPQDRQVNLQFGTDVKVFQRAGTYKPAADVYAGVLVLPFDDGDVEAGMTLNLSYSYNSPDSYTFIPMSDVHVLGLQAVFGNPGALPALVPLARVSEDL